MAPPISKSEGHLPASNNTRPKAISKMTFHGYGLNEQDSNECQDAECKFNPTKHAHINSDAARSVQHPDRLVVPGHRNDGPHDLSMLLGGGTPTGRGSWSFGSQKKTIGPVIPPLQTEAPISSLADLTLKDSTDSRNGSPTAELAKLENEKEIAFEKKAVTIVNLDEMLLKVMAEKSNPTVTENLPKPNSAKTDQMKAGKICSQAGESAVEHTKGENPEITMARTQRKSYAPTPGFGSMESGLRGLDGMNEEASQLHKYASKDLRYDATIQSSKVVPAYISNEKGESDGSSQSGVLEAEQKAIRRRWY